MNSTKWLSLVLLTVSAPCDRASAEPRFFPRTDWRPAMICPPIPALRGLSAVADVTTASDSTFAVLLGDERSLLVFDAAFRIVDRITFDKDGPRGVLRPASAVVTDSMIFVADDARSLVKRFAPDGSDAGSIRLSFIPRRLRMSGPRLVVTPLVAGGSPAELAFVISGGRATGIGGRIARYNDIGLNTLANMTSLAAFEDRIVVMHEMVVPFGYVLATAPAGSMERRFGIPLPADARARLGELPREPLTDRNVNRLAVVAFAATAAPPTGSVYYVTRSGDGARRPFQKLLVRMDSMFEAASVTPINVNPQHMVFMAARGSIIVVDSESEWFECRIS